MKLTRPSSDQYVQMQISTVPALWARFLARHAAGDRHGAWEAIRLIAGNARSWEGEGTLYASRRARGARRLVAAARGVIQRARWARYLERSARARARA